MAEYTHLNNAPVEEAILIFQCDASKVWDTQDVRENLASHFPDFGGVQEQRSFQGNLVMRPGKAPESTTSVSAINAYIIHKHDRTAAVQIRRDGFGFSQLKPYPGWEQFIKDGLEYWKVYANWMRVSEPFNISIRFINRLSYPSENFKLLVYFENPPKKPENTDWRFSFFREHYSYVTPDKKFTINSIFSNEPAHIEAIKVDFFLDLTISLTASVPEVEEPLSDLLMEMRDLKNAAFFSKLTELGLEPYR